MTCRGSDSNIKPRLEICYPIQKLKLLELFPAKEAGNWKLGSHSSERAAMHVRSVASSKLVSLPTYFGAWAGSAIRTYSQAVKQYFVKAVPPALLMS